MNNPSLCEECNVIVKHYLCIICKKTLVCPIYLYKRGYNELNYHPCVSCVQKNKTASNIKELDTDKPVLKCLKLVIYTNTSICSKAN